MKGKTILDVIEMEWKCENCDCIFKRVKIETDEERSKIRSDLWDENMRRVKNHEDMIPVNKITYPPSRYIECSVCGIRKYLRDCL